MAAFCWIAMLQLAGNTATLGGQSDPRSTVTFSSASNLVLIPVVVRDRKGRPVSGLRQEDFEVRDNGRKRQIASFSVENPGQQITSPDSPSEATIPERFIGYFIDDLSMSQPADLVYVRNATARSLNSMKPGDRAAIFTASCRILLDFTDDRLKLQGALSKLTAARTPDCRLSTGQSAQLAVLKSVVVRMSALPGRRSIIVISPGFVVRPEWHALEAELIDSAIRTQILIHSVQEGSLTAADLGMLDHPIDPSSRITERDTAMEGQLAASSGGAANLKYLAAATGGDFRETGNDLDSALRAVGTPDTIYVLGLSPEDAKPDGKFHHLKVSVRNGRDFSLQARNGYYAATAEVQSVRATPNHPEPAEERAVPPPTTTIAQAPSPSAETSGPAQASTSKSEAPGTVLQDEPVTFRSHVELVMVPVVVRDRKGNAVGGLSKQDFVLFDEKHRQEIVHFSVQHADAGVLQSSIGKSNTVAEKPALEKQQAVSAERFVAYVFDDIDIKFEDLVYVRDAAWRNISESLQKTDRVAIVTTSGRTLVDFTDDRAKLHDALFHLRPTSVYRPMTRECPNLNYYQAYAITKGMGGGVKPTDGSRNSNAPDVSSDTTSRAGQFTRVGIEDLENCNPMFNPLNTKPDPVAADLEVEEAARRVVSWREREIEIVLNSLKLLSDRMTTMPGQRSIILASPGFLVTDALWPEEMELIDRSIRAGVTIDALDAIGLSSRNPAGDIDEFVPPGAPHPHVIEEEVPFRKAEEEGGAQALAALTEGTGGKFIRNTNDFIGAYRQLANAPEFVYLLGFTPQNVKPNGSFHLLKVKLAAGAKYEVQARKGYFAPKSSAEGEGIVTEADQETRDAVFSRMEVRTLPVELRTAVDHSNPASAKLTVTVGIDVKQLRIKRADGRNNDDLTVVSAVFDRNGNFISGNRKIVKLRMRDETMSKLDREPLLLRTVFTLNPGGYLVRLVVRDEDEQTLDAQNQIVAIP